MRNRKKILQRRAAQRGAALVISMLILIVLTIIGVSAMQSTTIEERMARNMRDKAVAFQAGELALTAGENWIDTQLTRPIPVGTCAAPPCDVWDVDDINPGVAPWWQNKLHDQAFWQAQARSFTGPVSGVENAPRFVVEEQVFARDNLTIGTGPITGKTYYRVTSRGATGAPTAGATDRAQVVIQSTFVKRFN